MGVLLASPLLSVPLAGALTTVPFNQIYGWEVRRMWFVRRLTLSDFQAEQAMGAMSCGCKGIYLRGYPGRRGNSPVVLRLRPSNGPILVEEGCFVCALAARACVRLDVAGGERAPRTRIGHAQGACRFVEGDVEVARVRGRRAAKAAAGQLRGGGRAGAENAHATMKNQWRSKAGHCDNKVRGCTQTPPVVLGWHRRTYS